MHFQSFDAGHKTTRDRHARILKIAGLIGVGSTKREEEEEEQCAVCRMEFEPEEEVVMLPCKHQYHGECISQWLKDRKVGAWPPCLPSLCGMLASTEGSVHS